MNMAGVPVLFSVATILVPMMALLPIPLTTSRPFDLCTRLTTFSKLLSIDDNIPSIAFASKEIVRRPICKMERTSMIGKNISLMKEMNSKIEKTQVSFRNIKYFSCEKKDDRLYFIKY
jgi:hypothetical protein